MTVVNPITQMIEEFIRQQREHTEKTLEEIITKYDFIVGSKECKSMLMEILPEGANVIYSPYVESPTTVHMVKKFKAMDLMYVSQESEEKMTTEEAVEIIKEWLMEGTDGLTKDSLGYIEGWFHKEDAEAFDMAIKALEQEPFINKTCVSEGVCHEDKIKVLDKISAEIEREENWLMIAGYNAYNVDIAFNSIKKVLKESRDKE